MGTVLLVVLIVGAAVFLTNRLQGAKASKPVEKVSVPLEEKVCPRGVSQTAAAGPH